MKKLLFTTLILIFTTQTALTCTQDGHTGIMPENNMYVPTWSKNVSNVTEADFNEVMDRLDIIYTPVIKARGAKLVFERNWSNGKVNAYAKQSGKKWVVAMFGGLARHDLITKDGFAMVVCHELGHHIGGVPKKSSWFGGSWASNEGQADYFASLKCMRFYLENEDNIAFMENVTVPEEVIATCTSNYSSLEGLALCKRIAMAGLSLGRLLNSSGSTPVAFNTPDTKIVSKTNHNHPAAQCRLDTYFAGSLCTVDHRIDVSNNDVNEGVCARSLGHTSGPRPLCWYKP